MDDEKKNSELITGIKIECEGGKTFVYVKDSPVVTREYRLGIDISNEEFKQYVVIGTYKKDDKSYAFVENDPDILAQLLRLSESDAEELEQDDKFTF